LFVGVNETLHAAHLPATPGYAWPRYARHAVPDSLAQRGARATGLAAADDRGHRMRWDAGKLREAPPICPRDGTPATK
jgi:hypothetical protein